MDKKTIDEFEQEKKAIEKTIDQGFIILNPIIERLEKDLSNLSEYSIAYLKQLQIHIKKLIEICEKNIKR